MLHGLVIHDLAEVIAGFLVVHLLQLYFLEYFVIPAEIFVRLVLLQELLHLDLVFGYAFF